MTLYLENFIATGVLKYFRQMSSANFEFLINFVGRGVCKQDTNFRDSISMK